MIDILKLYWDILTGNTDHHDMLVVLLGAMALFMTFVLLVALGFLITVIAR